MASIRLGSFVFHAVMLALAVAAAAYWAVRLATPAPSAPPPAATVAPPRSADPLMLARLFGQVPSVAASSGGLQVLGVYVAGARSAALLAIDGKPPRTVVVGQEAMPGLVLRTVEPTRIVLEGRDARQELAVPPPPSTSLATAGSPAAAATPASGAEAGVRTGRVLTAPTVSATPSPRGATVAPSMPSAPRTPPARPSGPDGSAAQGD